jgi:hypothetical protein
MALEVKRWDGQTMQYHCYLDRHCTLSPLRSESARHRGTERPGDRELRRIDTGSSRLQHHLLPPEQGSSARSGHSHSPSQGTASSDRCPPGVDESRLSTSVTRVSSNLEVNSGRMSPIGQGWFSGSLRCYDRQRTPQGFPVWISTHSDRW